MFTVFTVVYIPPIFSKNRQNLDNNYLFKLIFCLFLIISFNLTIYFIFSFSVKMEIFVLGLDML